VPVQYKIFDHGGHGYGMANGVGGAPTDTALAVWPSLAAKWMAAQGFFQKATSLSPTRPAVPGFSGSHPYMRGGYDFLGRLRHLARGVL